jgi:uncharacterized membrane protein
MLKIETSTVINRPVAEVFAVLTNVENNPKWASGFLEAKKTSEGPIGVGTTWHAVQKSMGQRVEAEADVTEYEPNRKFALRSKTGPFPVKLQNTFEPAEGGTRVNFKLEGEPGGFFKLAEPLVARMAKRNIESDLANLKDLMEAHAL